VVLASAAVAIGFALVSTIMFGDPARYMSSHATPLVVLLAVYAFRQLAGWRMVAVIGWGVMLAFTHVLYFVVKARYGG
jgi:hypothetical protein